MTAAISWSVLHTIVYDWSRDTHNRSIGAADADLSAAAKLATYSAGRMWREVDRSQFATLWTVDEYDRPRTGSGLARESVDGFACLANRFVRMIRRPGSGWCGTGAVPKRGGSPCANRAITPPPRYRAASAIP